MPAVRFLGFHHGSHTYTSGLTGNTPVRQGHTFEVPGDKVPMLIRDFAGLGPPDEAGKPTDAFEVVAPPPATAAKPETAKLRS